MKTERYWLSLNYYTIKTLKLKSDNTNNILRKRNNSIKRNKSKRKNNRKARIKRRKPKEWFKLKSLLSISQKYSIKIVCKPLCS